MKIKRKINETLLSHAYQNQGNLLNRIRYILLNQRENGDLFSALCGINLRSNTLKSRNASRKASLMMAEQICKWAIWSDPHNINDTADPMAQGSWFMHIIPAATTWHPWIINCYYLQGKKKQKTLPIVQEIFIKKEREERTPKPSRTFGRCQKNELAPPTGPVNAEGQDLQWPAFLQTVLEMG